MADKCPLCGHITDVVLSNVRFQEDILCHQCGMSASEAWLRAQEDLVNRLSAYDIRDHDTQDLAKDRLVINHTPFASAAAHTIRIPSSYLTGPSSRANSSKDVIWAAEVRATEIRAREDAFHQISPSNTLAFSGNHMDCQPETLDGGSMIDTKFTHDNGYRSQFPIANEPETTSRTDAYNSGSEDTFAEPYMCVGYEKEGRSNTGSESRTSPQEVQQINHYTGLPYSTYNNPIFTGRKWWEYSGGCHPEDATMAGLR